jgi:hypothetical protein
MASNLATIRVELIANAQKFKSNIDQATKSMEKVDTATAKTGKGTKKLSSIFQNTAGSIAAVQGPLGPVAGRISAIGAIIGRVNPLMLVFTAGMVGIGLAVTKTVSAISNLEVQQGKLNALLKATGNAAGLVGRDIEIMAEAIGKGTLASVQGARDAAGVLLTFKSITGETFEETLKLTQDLAAVGFGSMQSAALQLGKALEEPETGLSALRRVGVSFTEQQKEQIKVLAMTGRQMEAQAIIIKTLKEQVGGAGEGAAGGLAGAYDTLKENINLFFERSASGKRIVDFLTNSISKLSEALGNQVLQITKLPDSANELETLFKNNKDALRILEKAYEDALKNKSKFFDSGQDKQDRAELELRIKLLKDEQKDIEKKIELIGKEQTVVNKAQIETKKHADKRNRSMMDEMRLATASGDKQKFILEEQIKLRDMLIGKLGTGAEAMAEINRIMEVQTGHFEQQAEVMVNFRNELENVNKIATGVANEVSKVGDTLVDAFLRGETGALDFKNILRELIISIQKTIIQTLILDQVNKFVKNAITGIFAPKVPGGATTGTTLPGQAGGGTIQQGSPTLVGERGPELFVPSGAGKIINGADTKSAMSGGGGVSVVQNLNFAVGITNTVRAEVMNMLPSIQQSTISAVADAKQRGGKFSKAFGA